MKPWRRGGVLAGEGGCGEGWGGRKRSLREGDYGGEGGAAFGGSCRDEEMEEGMAARRSGGGGGLRRRWWLEDSGIAMTAEKNPWPGQGVVMVVVAAAPQRRAAATATTVGLLPRPSVSSHLRWRRLTSFLK